MWVVQLGDLINCPRETNGICHRLHEEIMKITPQFPTCITQ